MTTGTSDKKSIAGHESSGFRLWLEKSCVGGFVCRLLDVKLIRFFMVAGLNTVFGYALFASLIFIGLHYTLAALIGQIIGILFNFRTYGALVFKNKRLNLLPRFVMVYAIMYICNIGGMTLIKQQFGANDYVASAIMCVPVGLLGFLLNKLFVFERIRHGKPGTAGNGGLSC